ncbi:MAG: AraC family transcriptional regulator, partial [Cyanobacteria bacterium P01_F01_bin.153]
GIRLDRHRLAQLLLKMDSVDLVPDSMAAPLDQMDTSGIFSASLSDALLDATLRLLKTLGNPAEAAILGEAIIDEIYYRLLTDAQGRALRILLRLQGPIQQIAKAVEYLHNKLDQAVSVEELAAIAHMSTSSFHKKFKEVMHLSPLQYIKLVRLNKARAYLMEGKTVSESGSMVGYNSPAQFSREYKRQFGISPSAAVAITP